MSKQAESQTVKTPKKLKQGLAPNKGLGSLFSEIDAADYYKEPEPTTSEIKKGVTVVDINKIDVNPTQPRTYFDQAALEELAESMATFGIIQPLLVKDEGNFYTIIAGERRYRAARIAKLTEVPVIIKEYSDMEILQVALLENIQRQDLTALEEAACYKRLMDEYFFSADDLAKKLGKNKHAIIASLHLLELCDDARALAAEGKLTASHAKVLLSIEDEILQFACANIVVNDHLSVRETEQLVKKALRDANKPEKTAPDVDENTTTAYKKAENELKALLGSQVNIIQGKKKSKIEIEYYNNEDLERLLHLLKKVG